MKLTIREFTDGENKISSEFMDSETEFKWRLVVNGETSGWYEFYQGILVFKGYGLCTAYWEGALPVERPFRISELAENITAKKDEE